MNTQLKNEPEEICDYCPNAATICYDETTGGPGCEIFVCEKCAEKLLDAFEATDDAKEPV